MSTPTIMQRIGKAGKDYVSGLKQIPLNESEFSGLRDRAAQSRAVRELNAAPIQPAPYVPAATDKVNPMAKFGSRPGEKRLDYALKPMPVYDMGGDVPQTSLDQVRAKVGDVDPVDDGQKEKKPLKQFVQGLKPMGDISTGAQVSPTGPAQTTTMDSTETQIAPAVLHDDGGETVDADNVNVNDGKHQVAVLKEGEKVLTPEQAEVYDKEQAKKTVENPGAQTEDAHPTDETAIQPQAPAPDKPLPTASHEERVAIKKDQQDALGMGVSGLTKLGLANIHAKQLGLNPVAVGDEATPAGFDVNQMTAPKGLNQGAQAPGLPKMADAVGPAQPAAPAVKPDFKTQLAQLKQDHSAALAERTPEGKVKADYIQAQINDLQKNNPFGTAENHPGFTGKLVHGLAKIGNIAGNIVAPGTMQLIPGTELNKQAQERGLQAQTAQDVATAEKANKPGATDTYKEATQGGLIDPAHPELGPQQAYVDEKDPSKIHFAGPMPPKAGAEKDQPANVDQQKDYQQRIANSGLTGQALQTYGTIPKGATPAELDKRFDEAVKLRGMNQKEQETAIQNQARKDAADEKQFEHEQARQDKLENQHFSYVDEKGQTQITTGDKLKELPEGTQTIPIKDVANLIGEARSMNAVQENMNVLHKDIEEHPEVFDNDAARTIVQTTTEQMNRASAGLLIAGTGGQVPIPSGFGDTINTALQNHALDDKTAKSVKNYIADYKALKDKAMVIQMMMQNGKMGRGGMQAFDSIVNQLPGGSTPDSATAARQMGALQGTVKGLMGKYPDKYADYTKAKPYEAKAQGTAPKVGDKQQHAGANYTFDGKQWVKQK